MKKAYLLIYGNDVGSREHLKTWVDTSPLVITWRHDLPNMFYLISQASANELYESMVTTLGKKGRFLIIEASDNRQGLMLPDTWYLLRNKTHKPKTATPPKLAK